MKFIVENLKEIKNRRGEVRSKVVRVYNKKTSKGLDFNMVNNIYKDLLSKYKASNIVITAKPLTGGWTTLKNASYNGNSLKYDDDDYFSSVPEKIAERLKDTYYSIDILINL
jgi:hypothetical protein